MSRATWRMIVATGIALSAASSNAQVTAPAWRLVEEVRISGATENISGVGFVVVLANGTVVFAEPQDVRLRFYDAAGRASGTFGRAGGGPGEFEKAGSMALLRGGRIGDTLWVYDMSARRFTLVSRDRTLLTTVRLPASWTPRPGGGTAVAGPRPVRSMEPIAYYANGDMLVRASFGPSGRGGGALEIVMALPSGEIAKTLAAELNPLAGLISVTRNDGAQSYSIGAPFQLRPHRAVAQDGSRFALGTTAFETAAGSAYFLTVVSATGDTLLSRRYSFPGNPITTRLADSAVGAMTRTHRTPQTGFRPYPPDVVEELAREMRAALPPFVPPVDDMHLASDNAIWLRRPATSAGIPHLVLNERGNATGTVTLPARSVVAAAARTSVWVIERDLDEVPSLVRYRLVR